MRRGHRLKSVLHKGAHVSKSAKIGTNTSIGVGSYVGPGVVIGQDCQIEDNVSIRNSTLGDKVVVKAGARIGGDGFGFVPALTNDQSITPKPQTLRVHLHDQVQIGSNCTIDRGSWRNTVIGFETKLDNLVHVGHNVHIGKRCLIAAQTGIAGSVNIGDRVLIGGQTGIAQYCSIGDGARIAGKSAVIRNVAAGTTVGGAPAVGIVDFHRQTVFLKNIIRKNGKDPSQ